MNNEIVSTLTDVPLQEGEAGRVLVAQVTVQSDGGRPVGPVRMRSGKEEIGPALAGAHSVQVVGGWLKACDSDPVDVLSASLGAAVHEYFGRPNIFFLESLLAQQNPTVDGLVDGTPGHY